MKNYILLSVALCSLSPNINSFAHERIISGCPEFCHNKTVTKSRWDLTTKKVYIHRIEGGNGGDGAPGGKIIINSKSDISFVAITYGGVGGKAGSKTVGYHSTKSNEPTKGLKGKKGFVFINSPKI